MSGVIDQNENTYALVPSLSINIKGSELANKMMDVAYLQPLLDFVSKTENDDGDYNFMPLSNLAVAYMYTHNRSKKRKEATKKEYLRELLSFLKYVSSIGKEDIRELSRFDVDTFQTVLEKQYPKTNTRMKKVVIVDSFLSWCEEEGYLKKRISRGFRPISKKDIKKEIPERDIDEEALKQTILFYKDNPKVQSLLLILGTSGLRLNEVRAPAWGDLYFDRRENKHYLKTVTKRDHVRHAHIKPYALEVLIEYRARVGLATALDPEDPSPFYPNRLGRHYTLSSLSTYLSECMAAAGLTTIQGHRVTPHFLRHYFSQTAFANGAPLEFISETLDHSSTKITKDNYLSRQMKKERDVSQFVDLLIDN